MRLCGTALLLYVGSGWAHSLFKEKFASFALAQAQDGKQNGTQQHYQRLYNPNGFRTRNAMAESRERIDSGGLL